MWQNEGLHFGLRAGVHKVYPDDSKCTESLPIHHRVIAIDRAKGANEDKSLLTKASPLESIAAFD